VLTRNPADVDEKTMGLWDAVYWCQLIRKTSGESFMDTTINAHDLLMPVDLRAYDLLVDAQVVYLVDTSTGQERLLAGAKFVVPTVRARTTEIRRLRIQAAFGTLEETRTKLWVATVKRMNPGRYA
jgi:hypothetical protein